MAVTLEIFFIVGMPAQTFPVQLDAGKLFVIESRDTQIQLAAAAEIDGVAHRYRRLFAEEARQCFFGFRVIFELGFDVRLSAYVAGKRSVADVVDNRNRLLQDGFQIVGQVFLRILKKGRLQADNGGFRCAEPAAFVLMRFYGQKTGVL